MHEHLLVSVVISTYNRKESLDRTLDALAKQTYPHDRYEVIVVDNGSTDETWDWVQTQVRLSPFCLHLLRRQYNSRPTTSRNMGWRIAQGDVIAFTDDDCLPSPEWLLEGVRAFSEEQVGLVQGETLPWLPDSHLTAFAVHTNSITAESHYYETCNMFYRKAALEEAGGFDEALLWAEDVDLGWSVKERGYQVRFCPGAIVYHAVFPVSFWAYLKTRRRMGDAMAVLKKHPQLRELERNYAWSAYFTGNGHPPVLRLLAGLALGLLFHPLFVPLLGFRYVSHYVGDKWRTPRALLRELKYLPLRFLCDLYEVTFFGYSSLKYRLLCL